jgi:hypothetical protein
MKRRDFIKAAGISCLGLCCNPLTTQAQSSSTGAGARAVSSLNGRTYDARELLNKYDAQAQWRRQLYLSVFDEAVIDGILEEMRNSYAEVIPGIPFIGKNNYHLQWVIPNAEKLADYLIAKNYGVTIERFSSLHLAQAAKDLYDTYTEEQRRQIGKSQFGLVSELLMRMIAFRSQLKLFEDDYLLTYIKGDGKDFDWGLDYTQCTNIILYEKYGAADLVYPLICNMDYVAGAALYTGYHRTKTLVLGDSLCDMRWKWQG